MSTSSISSSMFNELQQFQKDFQQLGKDLQSGNLSAAQSDFATLETDLSQSSSASTSQSSNPIAQAFNQLSQDLQAGNLSAAQQDYSTIQQDLQNQASQTHYHHHHHWGGSEDSQASQLFAKLGQDLQSGDLSSAQSDFNSLQQLLQNGRSSTQSSSTSYTGVSVNA